MQRGTEVKVGLIALLALALLAFFIFVISGYRFTTRTYNVCVTFDSALGLQRGDPVMLAGVHIGEVKAVTVDSRLKAQVTLTIEHPFRLYDTYHFQIASSGLLQQLSVEVVPPAPGTPPGAPLKPNQCVQGTASPTLSDLLTVGTQVLSNLNKISEMLRTNLSDQQLMGKLRGAAERPGECGRRGLSGDAADRWHRGRGASGPPGHPPELPRRVAKHRKRLEGRRSHHRGRAHATDPRRDAAQPGGDLPRRPRSRRESGPNYQQRQRDRQ